MMHSRRHFFALAFLITVGVGATASAQLTPTAISYGVYQYGKLVGEVYRSSSTLEHWVLYPTFVDASPANGAFIELRPNQTTYQSENDFFTRVPFASGARYVRKASTNSQTLPPH